MKKIEKIVVSCLALFPFAFIVLFFLARIGQGSEQFSNFNSAYEMLSVWSNNIQMRAVSEPLYQLLADLQVSSYTRIIFTNLFSYEALILVLHIGYQVLVFIPKLGIQFCEFIERKYSK